MGSSQLRMSLWGVQIIARVSVDNRTRALVQALQRASDLRLSISRVEDLSYHLLEFPETRGVAVKVGGALCHAPLCLLVPEAIGLTKRYY